MFCCVKSASLDGMKVRITSVEVDVTQGLPIFDLVGNMSGEVKEARERVKIALKNAGIKLPNLRITVNLAPAHLRKEGTAFDVPIAVGVLGALHCIPEESMDGFLMIGELGLDGGVKGVRGVLPIVQFAKGEGITKVLVPQENALEASLVDGVRAYPIHHISEVITFLHEQDTIQPVKRDVESVEATNKGNFLDFSDVLGQFGARRGAEIAAAGSHHLLMIGPPGSGKSMIAKRMAGILPDLTEEESIEVTAVHSMAGRLKQGSALMKKRTFLHPHHTITQKAMIGGGVRPRPGLISLAHNSILFLDELPEFSRQVIESLRQPLEDREVQIVRGNSIYTYPADFILIAAMNPCPCGYYPDQNKCNCTEYDVLKYKSKISGPIWDRIDLCCTLQNVPLGDLQKGEQGESSAIIKQRVLKARSIQQKRLEGSEYRFNAEIATIELKKYCKLGTMEEDELKRIANVKQLSARSYYKTIKIARTIADLDGNAQIEIEHIREAIAYKLVE